MYEKLTKNEYLLLSLINHLPLKLSWIIGMFGIPISDSEFVKIEDTNYVVNVNNISYIISDVKVGEPIFESKNPINLKKNLFSIVKEDIETTVGLAILNYLFLEYGLEGRVPYINKVFTFSSLEKEYIIPKLVINSEESSNNVSIRLYKKVTSVVTYIRNFVPVIVVSATEKTITSPPGVDKYKTDLIKEYKKKYGEDVLTDTTKALEIEKKLMAFDENYLKDDPTLGIATSKKIMGSSRKKKYLMIGPQSVLVEKSTTNSIPNSLLEGIPKDPKIISSIINGLRSGSFSRGFETKTSGLIAKYLIRATHAFKIIEDDCGVKMGITIVITKEIAPFMIGNYLLEGSKVKNITKDTILSLIDKTVVLRSPQYCKSEGDSFCKVCAGDTLARTENGVGLLAIGLGGKALLASLGKFHHKDLGLYDLKLSEFVR